MENPIAIIGGTAGIGYALALRLARAGREVIIGSRFPWKAEYAARTLEEKAGKAHVTGFKNPEAAAKADIVVLAVPFKAQINIFEGIKDALRPNTVLVDVTIPLKRSKNGCRLIRLKEGSATERLLRLLPENVDLVASFKNVSEHVLKDLSQPLDCDILICGDSDEAKKKVMEVIEDIEARPVDCGPLANSYLLEALGVLMINLEILHRYHVCVKFKRLRCIG
ncbi:NADPH-dependent F420 reductase [Candidatus Bathyarchaeota archaeon]|nr:NADPH-dependent F420 reductase [Candidatus Bathyarchaeota archaeon]RJS74674.1 MAG: NADPH-dependent F420 reductase [Candidatus Bathyarchaeota archaeon]